MGLYDIWRRFNTTYEGDNIQILYETGYQTDNVIKLWFYSQHNSNQKTSYVIVLLVDYCRFVIEYFHVFRYF